MSIAHEAARRIPPSTLPLRLQQAREWRDLNQIDLARALDVSRATISNYENGVTKPSRLQVNAWAVACDVDVEWLKTGIETEEPNGTTPGGGTPGKVSEKLQIHNVHRLVPRTRELVAA